MKIGSYSSFNFRFSEYDPEPYESTKYEILKGDRIAQGVIAAHFEEGDELSESERGRGGFGSTGVKYVQI